MEFKWRTKPLSKLIELIIDHRGKTPKKLGFEDFHDAGYPVLSAKHIKTGELVNVEGFRFANKSMYDKWMPVEIQEGDIVLTSEAPLGEVYYLNGKQKYVLGQRVFGLRTNPDILHPIYLVAWLTSSRGQASLNARATGSTVLGIKQSELLKINVDIPPPEIQNYIAEVYKNFSNKLELNHRINQTLEQIAQAIFKSWFVDFEPVHAKIAAIAEGRDPVRAAMSAISGKDANALDNLPAEKYAKLQATAELFPSVLVDSELGKIPEGWNINKLSQASTILNGFAFKSKDYVENGVFVLRTKNFSTEGYIKKLKDDVFLHEEFLLSHSQYLVQPFDFHMVMVGASIGKTAMIFPHHLPALRNQNMWCFRSHEMRYRFYIHFIIEDLVKKLGKWGSGSARAFFRKKDFKSQNILIPDKFIVDKFTSIVQELYNLIAQKNLENQNLEVIRDTLLPKLLSGEISPPDIETELTTT